MQTLRSSGGHGIRSRTSSDRGRVRRAAPVVIAIAAIAMMAGVSAGLADAHESASTPSRSSIAQLATANRNDIAVMAAVSGELAGAPALRPLLDRAQVSSASTLSRSGIAQLATANLNDMACGTNSLGGRGYESSCTGNGGQPEYWCADFAKWVWQNSGVTDLSGLNAAARSFYLYGQSHGTLSNTPAVGDAVVFSNARGDTSSAKSGINHVAIVTQVNANGTINSVSGDFGGKSGSQATFAGSSHVLANPAYGSAVDTFASAVGMWVTGYVVPVGLTVHRDRDLGGDGYGDLVTVSSDGYLYYYANGSLVNPGHVPFTNVSWRSPTATWGGVKAISVGDVSGDGIADLMVVGGDGYLYYYPNNAATNAGHAPFASAAWRSPTATWANNRLG